MASDLHTLFHSAVSSALETGLHGTSAPLKPTVLGPHCAGFLMDIKLVFFQRSTDSCFDLVDHPVGNPTGLWLISCRAELPLKSSWLLPVTHQSPSVNYFCSVDLYSDVLGWVTGTSQGLVRFCPHPPGRNCLAE